ncbi:MAG TPA: outer membrane beta-barrel protein [Thermoanaerobaculia bacterium]|nr:outer membrane beta-barrel protein [Thermoanaerobaculia bacterium]
MWVLLLASFGLYGVSAPAVAQGYFGISAGLYEPDDKGQEQTQVYDLRGGYRIDPRLGFEWSLSRLHLSDTVPFQGNPTIPGIDFDSLNLKLELYTLDLSAQWFPIGDRLIVFGGPGVAQLDSDLVVTFFGKTFTTPDRTNIFTVHAGVAYVWNVNNHFFIRPEARARHYFGDEVTAPDRVQGFYYSYKATNYQAGLTVGWRYGS